MSTMYVNNIAPLEGTTINVASGNNIYVPGHVVNVQRLVMDTVTTTSTSFVYNIFTTTYTPLRATHKLLLQYNMGGWTDVDSDANGSNNGLASYEYQIGSNGWVSVGNNQIIPGRGGNGQHNYLQELLSPNTTEAISFRCGVKNNDGGGRQVLMRGDLGGLNTLIIQEIAQ